MDSEREEKAKQLVRESEHSVSVGYVSRGLDITWGTARGVLLSLAVEEEISAEKTENGWIFYEE